MIIDGMTITHGEPGRDGAPVGYSISRDVGDDASIRVISLRFQPWGDLTDTALLAVLVDRARHRATHATATGDHAAANRAADVATMLEIVMERLAGEGT